MVSFTGSAAAGRRVAEVAAATPKRVTLELGGKSANVILPDADLATAVKVGVAKAFVNSGQTCNALTRMLVHRDGYDEAVELAAGNAGRYAPGDPMAEGIRLGPLASAAQRDRVSGYIEKGLAEGARAATGGPRPPAGLATRLLRAADGVRRRHARHGDRAGGDLRAGAVACCRTSPRTRPSRSPTARPTAWPRRSGRPTRTTRWRSAGGCGPGQVEINGGAFNVAAPFGGFGQSGYGRELGRARPGGVPGDQGAAVLRRPGVTPGHRAGSAPGRAPGSAPLRRPVTSSWTASSARAGPDAAGRAAGLPHWPRARLPGIRPRRLRAEERPDRLAPAGRPRARGLRPAQLPRR